MTAEPAAPFAGTVAPGTASTGVYLFSFPDPLSGPVTVSVNYSAQYPIAQFTADFD